MLTQNVRDAKSLGEIQENPVYKPSTVEQLEPEIDTADGEGVVALIDLNDLKYSELLKMAKDKGLDIKQHIKKPELIDLLTIKE